MHLSTLPQRPLSHHDYIHHLLRVDLLCFCIRKLIITLWHQIQNLKQDTQVKGPGEITQVSLGDSHYLD